MRSSGRFRGAGGGGRDARTIIGRGAHGVGGRWSVAGHADTSAAADRRDDGQRTKPANQIQDAHITTYCNHCIVARAIAQIYCTCAGGLLPPGAMSGAGTTPTMAVDNSLSVGLGSERVIAELRDPQPRHRRLHAQCRVELLRLAAVERACQFRA